MARCPGECRPGSKDQGLVVWRKDSDQPVVLSYFREVGLTRGMARGVPKPSGYRPVRLKRELVRVARNKH